ncbi:hypothetical protein [Epilithonimonas arachidiradicis]|uniref:Transmembrane protein n=1 Tax=Epilithonimonas arachidiradicis TaxID=1617282 RepID=A0A420DBJ5_9FLAO|nr:hypothetical protein [Epilithonimonas arachidiradicis]RKE88794.1 hypothetical protein BXY58_0918 [Epilithonimonas arachidiradicis]GGG55004.1 hypothetical protein GCM10007332_15800 [Epilithonimonas arachidiradicis]
MNETLNSIRNRPRFKLCTNLSPEEYEVNLRKYLDENRDKFYGNINREVATIFVKTEDENYWKPNLALRIEKEDDITVIRGIFGPSSAVWTFFMFLYFLFTVAWMTFFTLYYVEKQINSNNYPWALPCSFVVLVFIGITYAAARFGQLKGKEEMNLLRKFAEESTLPIEKED